MDENIKMFSNNQIMLFEKAYPDKYCDSLIDYFENKGKKYTYKGLVGKQRNDKTIKKTIDLSLHKEPNYSNLKEEVSCIVNTMYDIFFTYWCYNCADKRPYIDSFLKNKEIDKLNRLYKGYMDKHLIYEFVMKKYLVKDKGFFNWHYDHNIIPHKVSSRKFSFCFYLNDVEEGGETQFYFQKLGFNPKKGSALIFSPYPTQLHCSLPPKSNDKYVFSTWFCEDYEEQNPEEYKDMELWAEKNNLDISESHISSKDTIKINEK